MLLPTLEIDWFRITAAVKMWDFSVGFLGGIVWLSCDSLALHLLICQKSNVFGAIACPLSGPGTGTGQFWPGEQRFYMLFRLLLSQYPVPLTPTDTSLGKLWIYTLWSSKPGISVNCPELRIASKSACLVGAIPLEKPLSIGWLRKSIYS
jgi:hypothetical protein